MAQETFKLRIYLDTSVFSAYADERLPDRQQQTRDFWRRLGEFEPSTSELARTELSLTTDQSRRRALLRLLDEVEVMPILAEMTSLAQHYVGEGVFALADVNDALHVAAAVLMRQDVLVSWNFRHLVNRRRRAQVNEINVRAGLPQLDIVAPPEL